METMYFGGYATEFPGGQPVSGYMSMPPMNPQSPQFPTNVRLLHTYDIRYFSTIGDMIYI